MRHPQLYLDNPAATAAEYHLAAARAYGHARTEAKRADREYHHARNMARQAAWLMGRPQDWDEAVRYTPARYERDAATAERMGNTYLRAYFRTVDHARHCTRLARRYEVMAGAR